MVGLADVKRQAITLAAAARARREREEAGLPVRDRSNHIVFTGNPGVGKTTVARTFKDLFYGLGVVKRDHYAEVATSDLMGGYMGQTPERTKKFLEDNKGGVIFIDEAYKFSEGEHNEYGRQALNEILTFADDHKADTVIILAGYPEAMQGLLASNPGLPRRFPNVIELPDLDRDGMSEVMHRTLQNHLDKLGNGGHQALEHALDRAYPALQTGNAGEVNNLYDRIDEARDLRLAQMPERSLKDKTALTVEDINSGLETYLARAAAKHGKLQPTGRRRSRADR